MEEVIRQKLQNPPFKRAGRTGAASRCAGEGYYYTNISFKSQ